VRQGFAAGGAQLHGASVDQEAPISDTGENSGGEDQEERDVEEEEEEEEDEGEADEEAEQESASEYSPRQKRHQFCNQSKRAKRTFPKPETITSSRESPSPRDSHNPRRARSVRPSRAMYLRWQAVSEVSKVLVERPN
jgi:hypothetical protein